MRNIESEIKNTDNYLQIKRTGVFVIFVVVSIEFVFGVLDQPAIVSSYLGLLLTMGIAYIVENLLRRKKIYPNLLHFSLAMDLLLICMALYFSGGPENSWWFLPVIIPFIAGYLFDTPTSLLYAFAACFFMVLDFGLEYFGLIPHYNISQMPFEYWRNTYFILDYMLGMVVLYILGTLVSGYFYRFMGQITDNLEKSLSESKDIQKMSEDNRKALMNVMEDLTQARDELELRVTERTGELEEIKDNLEVKVEERTGELEKSRRAILHMLRDLKEDVSKLKEVDRMKNEFISVVSHELRTPLTPLMDYASILLEGLAGPYTDKQKEIFQSLLRLSKRELNLINSLLDISRLEIGSYKPVKVPLQLRSLIQDSIMDVSKDAAGKKITISSEIEEGVSTIMADENLIARLIAQLLNNALKFTPEGGNLKIKCVTEGDHIKFEISDNGIGIAKEKLGKLFQKFYQADSTYARKFGGMGLGLAICRQIVEVHNGKIWVESEGLGQGTKFIFTLPING